jgi:hypothetical protein
MILRHEHGFLSNDLELPEDRQESKAAFKGQESEGQALIIF